MGKSKRRRDEETMDELKYKLKKLERRLNKRSRRDYSTDESRSSRSRSRLSRSRRRRTESPYNICISPSNGRESPVIEIEKSGTDLEEMVTGVTSDTAPDKTIISQDIEQLLGQEGAPLADNSIELHESLSKRWMAILQNGLNVETKSNLLKKYNPPKNCGLLIPPKLNEEVEAAINESGVKRDKRLCEGQVVLASAISTLGQVLNNMLEVQGNANMLHIELISDSSRLLCDLFHEKSITRRALILPGLNKDMKELMEKAPITEYLFGDKLQEKVTAIKAVKKSGQEMKNTQSKVPLKPTKSLNYRGPQRPAPRPSGPKPKLRRTTYHTNKSTRARHSPKQKHHHRRRGQDRR